MTNDVRIDQDTQYSNPQYMVLINTTVAMKLSPYAEVS